MVTGRVEVREEVERTGCSESVREEVVGDAYRHSFLPTLHTQRKQSSVYSVNPSSVVCRHLIGLLFSPAVCQLRWWRTLKHSIFV